MQETAPRKRHPIRHALSIGFAVFVVACALLVIFWNWDWFIPLVEAQASAALGRRVTLTHLHVKLGRNTVVSADGVTVDNPPDFPKDAAPLAKIGRLSITASVMDYVHGSRIVLPNITVDQPDVHATVLADGKNNFSLKQKQQGATPAQPSAPPEIGDLVIDDGKARFVDPKLRADFELAIATRGAEGNTAGSSNGTKAETAAGATGTTAQTASSGNTGAGAEKPGGTASGRPAATTGSGGETSTGVKLANAPGVTSGSIVISAKGTYAAQPITGHFVGGALLSLRDAHHPYPIDLHVENGATKASLVGTVENPLNFAGARLKLEFSGPDMANLFPLTGIPIPQTPPFSIAGNLDYQRSRIQFTDFAGRVGSSDLEGDITVDPHTRPRPDVTMDLSSRRVDLTDLGGFIGTPPGKASTPGETASEKRALATAEKKKTVLPDTPFNLPKLRAADIHLKYRGEHIENKYTPFDKLVVAMDIEDGAIRLHPLDLVIGDGSIASQIALVPEAHDLIHTDADIQFRHLQLSRLMAATHSFKGDGIIGGEAKLVSDGNSVAGFMGHGNGEVKLVLVSAGSISALLVDIAGLEFGNALLSALGIPNQAKIDCFVTDLPLDNGVMSTKAFLLDTTEAQTTAKGRIDWRDQTMDLSMTTRSKHFSIGSLPGPIDITGPLGDPSIRPGAEVVARAGAAAGLGVLLTPLGALLPTIQFGVGNNNACTRAEAAERQPLKVPAREPVRHYRRHERHETASR